MQTKIYTGKDSTAPLSQPVILIEKTRIADGRYEAHTISISLCPSYNCDFLLVPHTTANFSLSTKPVYSSAASSPLVPASQEPEPDLAEVKKHLTHVTENNSLLYSGGEGQGSFAKKAKD